MIDRKLLLLSSSRSANTDFLEAPAQAIRDFLGDTDGEVAFVPFAGVTVSYSDYAALVRDRFRELGYTIRSVHEADNPARLLARAAAVVVGGGNTFHLVSELQRRELMSVIRDAVRTGTPYMGWSAGSNLACPTLRTTNDMPIEEPESFAALNLVPFQINPHYSNALPDGHRGETRDQRLAEFITLNREVSVVGLPEGTGLRVDGARVKLIGPGPARVFRAGAAPRDVGPDEPLDFLLEH
ncbi:MAG: dipeptidase PepE [Gammaproteobacteria bacterium]|jgi:dipeptidase E